tara:strand:- start:49 stop:447 length:399 start_codon:yes stop_codon:yes gene_type:complete
MEKYLYFRTQATLADDDDSGQSAVFPLSNFVGMHPTSDTALTLFFKPQIRVAGGVTDGSDFTNNDSVVLTVGTNDHRDAMQALIKAFKAEKGFNGDGDDSFVIVADDLSTGTKYAVTEVTACGAITIGAAFA